MKLSPLIGTIGVATLLAAFGYTALRAHWNFLGVSVSSGVPAERYIAETWDIAAQSIPVLLFIGLLVVTAAALGSLMVRRFARWKPHLYGRLVKPARIAVPAMLLVALIAAEVGVLRVITTAPACRYDILLGLLAPKRDAGCFDERAGTRVFYFALLTVIAAFAATQADKLSTLQVIARLMAIALFLQLGAVHGYAVKKPVYRVVRLTEDDGMSSGMLLLQTDKYVHLWDVVDGRGRIRILPAGPLESGPAIDALEAARTVAADRHPNAFLNFCNRRFAGGR